MTNTLDLPNELVNVLANAGGDSISRPLYPPGVETIADRVQKVLDREGWSQSELSRRAGLTRSHIGWIIKHPSSPVETDTLRKIADAARVSSRWLAFGEGAPDSLDTDAPAVTESSEPIAENIPGYLDVEAIDRRANPEMEEVHWLSARKAAAYVIHGPAAPGDAIKLARLAREFADPARVRKAFADQEERLKAMNAEMERERLEFQRQLAEMKAGKRPSAKKVKTVAAAEQELGKRATEGIDETSGKKNGRG
jgi:transcriptional regulator with XRE-family HTH domain